MFGATWWVQRLVADRPPWVQLLICLPVGATVGVVFICIAKPQRRVALHLAQTLLEFLSNRQKQTKS